jgi:predicted phosphodiesterase
MRIVHFSDIHLREDNIAELKNNYIEAIISELSDFNNETKKIDLVIITGDLVDKGGFSLQAKASEAGAHSHYEYFEKIFIDPISRGAGISKDRFLFIPGNHDVDESKINWLNEKELVNKKMMFVEHHHLGTEFLSENLNSYENSLRIKNFKEFERNFQSDNIIKQVYQFTENHSSFIYSHNNTQVGIILVNDSWLCKSLSFSGECKRLYFGYQQLYDSLEWLKQKGVQITFCLMHHNVSDYMEEVEVERFLNKNVHVLFNGHYHEQDFKNLSEDKEGYLSFRVSAGLLRPNEKDKRYKPGFQIVDFDFQANTVSDFKYFIYNYDSTRLEDISKDLKLGKPKLPLKRDYSPRTNYSGPTINDVNDFIEKE